jgi:hypothetical protein
MGLAISVGVLAGGPGVDPEAVEWDREQFRHVNRVLAENGLPLHDEPEVLPEFTFRGHMPSFPYEWLFYLHRAVAFARQAPDKFCPVREGENPRLDKRVQDEWNTYIDSHVVCHSYSEGFYVPIDFGEPLIDSRKENGLTGVMLGSSVRALAELVRTAPLLGINLQGQTLTDADARVIAAGADGAHPYWIERKVWLTFFETFRHSVEHKCAVVFG